MTSVDMPSKAPYWIAIHMPAPEKKPIIKKMNARLPGVIMLLKVVNPKDLSKKPNGLSCGVNIKMTSSTTAGPTAAPGMKKSVRRVDETRPGRMCRSNASSTTSAIPTGTEMSRNFPMLAKVNPSRESLNTVR